MTAAHDARIKLAGPLMADGGMPSHGVKGEEFLLPKETRVEACMRFLTPGHTPLKVKPFCQRPSAHGRGDDR
ncbi:hypothetical protein KCP70_03000 [Salmonella enterica subsp. enterica]|nr:hypothetical protein KCP70_03000 [Salmonella enterica subsp. enterica]